MLPMRMKLQTNLTFTLGISKVQLINDQLYIQIQEHERGLLSMSYIPACERVQFTSMPTFHAK